ncbi:MAG: NRDE family protein [Planctomycetes bacterium]|nr:NRDE family protein [Planctomycetota bacterium]MCB9905997.1 NRDE family protein [Planctomycetota bacterium]
MCTVTWFASSEGFELFSNRDEHRLRLGEHVPREYEQHGTRFLAPRDGDAGGTWISVNEFGVALCLLNNYQAQDVLSAELARSRGLLVLALADCKSLDEVSARTPVDELARHRGFRLLALESGSEPRLIEWDGSRRRESRAPGAPLVSSSVDLAGAERARTRIYRELAHGGDPRAAHLAYHASHAEGPGPLSVCMHRPDAATRSLTHVVVAPERVGMRHGAGAPCRTPLGDALQLGRRSPISAGS